MSAKERTEFLASEKLKGRIVGETFDSNAITPGTEFMQEAADLLREYIQLRVSGCEAWKDLQVILSDSSVVGEGEHKLLEYIRVQRTQSKNYDPNAKHVIYGMVSPPLSFPL